jgi:hypothetical protein
MRIAYVSVDEVNQELALRIAERCGVALFPLSPQEPLPWDDFDAVLYDLDGLQTQQRRLILTSLTAKTPRYPVGVHSYNLGEAESKALRENGITVFRRLGRKLVQRLRTVASRGEEDRRTILTVPASRHRNANIFRLRPPGGAYRTMLQAQASS